MSDHLGKKIWIIGAGYMAVEYAKVLNALNVRYEVIGRGEESADKFQRETGHPVIVGGLELALLRLGKIPMTAIVAVGMEQLAPSTIKLLRQGFNKVLVEKPGGLNEKEICQVADETKEYNAEVFIAYNRRFYASTIKAQEIIKEDGGVKSFNFEFTEWSHEIEKLNKPKQVLSNWFLGNSTHVVDLAFYLGGEPKEISCYTAGGLDWHPKASIYAGAGVSKNGALFSYQANWRSPGRWGVEVITDKHRLIFRPMEKLHIQKVGSVSIEEVPIDDELDIKYKPGIYKQTETFLIGNVDELLTIKKQVENLKYYQKINASYV